MIFTSTMAVAAGHHPRRAGRVDVAPLVGAADPPVHGGPPTCPSRLDAPLGRSRDAAARHRGWSSRRVARSAATTPVDGSARSTSPPRSWSPRWTGPSRPPNRCGLRSRSRARPSTGARTGTSRARATSWPRRSSRRVGRWPSAPVSVDWPDRRPPRGGFARLRSPSRAPPRGPRRPAPPASRAPVSRHRCSSSAARLPPGPVRTPPAPRGPDRALGRAISDDRPCRRGGGPTYGRVRERRRGDGLRPCASSAGGEPCVSRR